MVAIDFRTEFRKGYENPPGIFNLIEEDLSDGSSKGVCPELETKLYQEGRDLAKSNKDWENRK